MSYVNEISPKTANYGGIYSGVYERAKIPNPIVNYY